MEQRGLHVLAIVPSVNTTVETEMRAYCPQVSRITVARIERPKALFTAADIPAYVERGVETVRGLDVGPVDLVAYGCTSAGFLLGRDKDLEVAAAFSALVEAPAVTAASSMVEALRHSKVRSVAVVTPYQDAVNESLRRMLEDAGVKVAAMDTFRARTTDEILAITAQDVLRLARATMTDACDGLFIGCAQLPTIDIMPQLRAEFDRPVWSSVRAMSWAGMRSLSRDAEDLAA